MGIAHPREDRVTAGIAAMVLAVGFFTCIDTSAKWLILSGLPILQVVFARYAVHFVLALGLYLPREGAAALRSNSPGRLLLRSGFLVGSTLLNFAALRTLPITVTTTIMFAVPILVTLLAIPVLGERVGLRRVIAVCTGFAGVLVVTRPWGAAFDPAMLFSLGALGAAAMYFVMTRMLAGIEATSTQQIWSSGLAALVMLPVSALGGWERPGGALTWSVFLAVGVFGGVGHILATVAHRWADASVLAPVVYAQVVFAALASVAVFGTWPTAWTLGGGAIIMASGLYIWQREGRSGNT